MPRLSVVVVAFDRRDYVLEALSSAKDQIRADQGDELLLVKNFADATVDSIVEQWGIRPLRPEGSAQGRWLAQAAEVARGDVLVFLDDDDLFAAGKLDTVRAEFSARPGLGYYHNAQTRFREVAPASEPTGGPPPGSRVSRPAIRVSHDEKRPGLIQTAWDAGGAFNLSSIAARCDLLRSNSERLSRIQGGAAAFLFYCAVLSEYELSVDPAPLTLYRLHDSNISGSGAASRRIRWVQEVRLAPVISRDAAVILEMVEASGADPRLVEPVRRVKLRNDLARLATDPRAPRREWVNRTLELLRLSGPNELGGVLPYLLLGFARTTIPSVGGRLLDTNSTGAGQPPRTR